MVNISSGPRWLIGRSQPPAYLAPPARHAVARVRDGDVVLPFDNLDRCLQKQHHPLERRAAPILARVAVTLRFVF